MDGEVLKAMYSRWLLEVWGAGRYEVADELLHVDLIDHNRLEGQPDGRAGDVWAARAARDHDRSRGVSCRGRAVR